MKHPHEKRIGLDFDGVIQHHPGTHSQETTSPVPGALEFVQWARGAGYEVVIFTARMSKAMELNEKHHESARVKAALERWGFPDLRVTGSKPDAALYVDDRGFRFEGPESWPAVRAIMEAGAPRWEKMEGSLG